MGISTDVADPGSVNNAFKELQKEMGSAHLAAAVFNVGGGFIRKPFLDLSIEEFMGGMEANGYGSRLSMVRVGGKNADSWCLQEGRIPLLACGATSPSQSDEPRVPSNIDIYVRHSCNEGLCTLFSVLDRQVRAEVVGSVASKGVWPARRPRCSCHH